MADQVMLLSQVHGDGRITYRALAAAGFDTLAAIKETEVQVLADRARLSMPTAERLKLGALEMSDDDKGSRHSAKPGTSPQSKARRSAADRVAGRKAKGQFPPFSEGILSNEAALLSHGNDPQTSGAARKHSTTDVKSHSLKVSAMTDGPHVKGIEASIPGDRVDTLGSHSNEAMVEVKVCLDAGPADGTTEGRTIPDHGDVTTTTSAPASDGVRKQSGGYWSFG